MSPDLDILAPRSSTGTGPSPEMDARAREMNVKVEELPRWRRRLTIVLSPERVRRERQRVTLELGRRLRLPGFRAGKAPPELLRKRFRTEIEDDLARSLLRDGLREALEARGLDPIAPAVVQSLEVGEGDAFHAVAEIDVRPQIALARTTGFRIDVPALEIAPDAVERVLQRLREERAELRPVDRPAARGDLVIADVEPLDGSGQPSPAYEVLLGSGQVPPEVESQLEGGRPGEEHEVALKPAAESVAPQAGSTPTQASPPRRFRLRVKEVKERILPELDDAFAADVSQAGSLVELRERIAENLRLEASEREERELRDRLLDAVAEANGVEVPAAMVERYVERLVHPDGRSGGLEPAGVGAPAREPEAQAELARLLQPVAERTLRRHLVLEAAARAGGLEPSEEQLDAYLRERLEPGASLEEARRALEQRDRLDELRLHLRNENVFAYLKNHSTVHTTRERSPAGD